MGKVSTREGDGVGVGASPSSYGGQGLTGGSPVQMTLGGTAVHSACSEKDSRCLTSPATANLSYES